MFKRKIDNELLEWKQTPNHKPLVVKGVRQCGKTSSVRQFSEQNYKEVVYLDFREHPEYRNMFTPNLDVTSIVMRMSLTPGLQHHEFVTGETCFVFDEIQDCPMARASLKYFFLDGRFDVICTGSLLGVSGYKTKEEFLEEERASIPVGFEEIITMYPMDFEEWLWANGVKPIMIDYLRHCYNDETPVDEVVHETMREYLRNYIIVGGMPEAVVSFVETKKMNKVIRVQRRIIDDYKSDMIKYASQSDKTKIIECFESIPTQLAREYKKFTYTSIRKGARGRDYAGCLRWIEDAGIIRRCNNIRTTELPLDGQKEDNEFKVYMADIGLLISLLEDGTQLSILQGGLGAYKGAIYENVVADLLGKMGRKLYYFHKDSGLELDFVIRYKGECVPIECKASSGKAKSLTTVLKNKDVYHVDHAVKLSDGNIGREGGLLTLPLYLGFLLSEM